jgi:hypothetical protein
MPSLVAGCRTRRESVTPSAVSGYQRIPAVRGAWRPAGEPDPRPATMSAVTSACTSFGRVLGAVLAAVGVAWGGAACTGTVAAPAGDDGIGGDVRTVVHVRPQQAAPGEPVTLLAIATNVGRDTALQGCGQGLGFQVTAPDGRRHDPSAGPSICPLFDSNVLTPGETDTVTFRWSAPAVRGAYRVRAGVRSDGGLRALSAPEALDVR